MMINNPNRNIRLIDLLDMFTDDLYSFDYNKIYDVVGDWLKTEKSLLIDGVDYDDFIHLFCDRYFRRCLNFDTFLDFKIALRNTLQKYREKAKRMYEMAQIEIDPLKTYDHNKIENVVSALKNSGESFGNNKNKSVFSGNTDNNDTTTNKGTTSDSTGYKLHSDTPSDSVNVENLIGTKSNYITYADNDHNKTITDTTNTNKGNTSTNSENNDTSEQSNTYSNKTDNINDLKNHEYGYDGIPSDLINKYIDLKLDVINFYMDCIENECLFSNILY